MLRDPAGLRALAESAAPAGDAGQMEPARRSARGGDESGARLTRPPGSPCLPPPPRSRPTRAGMPRRVPQRDRAARGEDQAGRRTGPVGQIRDRDFGADYDGWLGGRGGGDIAITGS